MAVVVKNEGASPFYFGERAGGSTRKKLEPGQIDTISDQEWDSVPVAKRGAGAIKCLWPNDVTSDTLKVKIDHYAFNGTLEPRYVGSAVQGSATNQPVWTIRRLSHTSLASKNYVTEVQVLEAVAWDDRASLSWDA